MTISDRLLNERIRGVDLSGVRRVFELADTLENPINLSIGQPDCPVDDAIKRGAIEAIESDRNGYSLTGGVPELREAVGDWLGRDVGWEVGSGCGALVTSGTSGAILLAFMTLLEPGDEVVIPDPYFVMYPHAARAVGATPVFCDAYPDFRMTAERVAPLITERTKMVLLNTPSNPAGVALGVEECRDLLELCRSRGVLLVSDEIYDEFAFSEARLQPAPDASLGNRCPSPARFAGAGGDVLLIRGFGKTYGVTGWRLGYAAGPSWLIDEMAKLQQYTFVCPPTPLQAGVVEAFRTDVGPHIEAYQRRRDLVVGRLSGMCEIVRPDGAVYVYVGLPERHRPAASFARRCIERELLVIPGSAFSRRDTHVRLSLTAPAETIERGLDVLEDLLA